MRRALAAAALLCLGCERPLTAPRILAVAPTQLVHGTVPPMEIELDAVFPYDIDYGVRAISVDTRLEAAVGDLPVRGTQLIGDDRVTGSAPFGLPVGVHDARVDLADGRSATLAAAVSVTPGAFPDSFAIDPIPTQVNGEPFTITIHAIGGQAAEFRGAVRISASHSTVFPGISGHFAGVTHAETIEIPAPGMGVTITVEDAQGHQGTSNPFDILN